MNKEDNVPESCEEKLLVACNLASAIYHLPESSERVKRLACEIMALCEMFP